METKWDSIMFPKFLSIPEVPEKKKKGLVIKAALGVEKFNLENWLPLLPDSKGIDRVPSMVIKELWISVIKESSIYGHENNYCNFRLR